MGHTSFQKCVLLERSIKTFLRGDFLQIRVSSAQKSNESDSRLRNLIGKSQNGGQPFYH